MQLPTFLAFFSKFIKSVNVFYRFSSVQSKSNRFKTEDPICYDPNGNRIFGESDDGDEEINCRCSRKRWEMEQKIDLDSNDDG